MQRIGTGKQVGPLNSAQRLNEGGGFCVDPSRADALTGLRPVGLSQVVPILSGRVAT